MPTLGNTPGQAAIVVAKYPAAVVAGRVAGERAVGHRGIAFVVEHPAAHNNCSILVERAVGHRRAAVGVEHPGPSKNFSIGKCKAFENCIGVFAAPAGYDR